MKKSNGKAKQSSPSSTEDKESLNNILTKVLLLIQEINGVEKDVKMKIDNVEKKLSTAKTEKDKMECVLEIETLRFNFYKTLEKEYKELSPLFADIYHCANRIGGPVLDTLDLIYDGVSKGLNLPLLEKQCKQMQKCL